jgi:shikimate dehydrogenase
MSPRIVDGATQILGIFGDPIRQVRAPELWSALFRLNAINAVCIPLHVKARDLASLFAGMRHVVNLVGLIATIPHKPAAAQLVDALTPRAKHVAAVNVMRREDDGRWTGDILDGIGFLQGLQASGQQIDGRRALVVGAGGVGSAIAFALAEAGAHSVHVSDIARDRAADLARRLEAAGTRSGTSPAIAKGFDLVVNASPVGMQPGDPVPVDCADLQRDAIVGDVVVHPRITPLLTQAQARGCHVQPGTVMMDHQLAAMGEFFRFPAGDYSPEAAAKATAS